MLTDHLKRTGSIDTFPACLNAAKLIANNMPIAKSIDNFLHSHNENKIVKLCGKLAIVRSILQAERNSALYVDHPSQSLDQLLVANSWFNRLAQVLFEEMTPRNLGSIFENVSFITFNYDRCIEIFLQHALRSYFDLTQEQVNVAMQGFDCYSPLRRHRSRNRNKQRSFWFR